MATLILTAVGTAVGGPLGGAIGAIIGQQADAAIFAPRKRHGPRLGELAVQTSSYGTAIPKLFGTMRVAGTVIWSTDLVEERSTSGGGKGRPKTVTYNYSASFAVALSGRPIRSVRRIWADGKLLRGAAGDFKSACRYRLHIGAEGQERDPLIAAAEGIGQTPAYRGIAYAVFEDFQLADYGNRIPSLTFEVVADEQPVAIGAIAERLSDGRVVAGPTPSLIGYAASGDSVRGVVEALGDVAPLSLTEEDGRLKIAVDAGELATIAKASTGVGGRTEIIRRAASSVAGEVSIAYHDAARDYQTGLQRAVAVPGTGRADRWALPAVLSADGAKAVAEYRLASLWAGRASAKVRMGWRLCGLRPGMAVRLEGQSGLWKVRRWTLEPMTVALDLVRIPETGLAPALADPGRPVAQPDLPTGPTILRLFDLPLYEDRLSGQPRLFVMAAGAEAGWRKAELTASYDGGASWTATGGTAAPAVMGIAAAVLGTGGSALLDLRHEVEVELLNDGMWLESRDDAALVGGANLAVLGDELIQFGSVEPLGNRRFRLSRLLRGRRGTEWAAAQHRTGEAFALIEPEALAAMEPPAAFLGGEARLLAIGLGDGVEGVEARLPIAGESTRPPSPVHLRAERLANGDVAISWVRRSRSGWAWLSGSDTPLGEESEAYRLRLSGAAFARETVLGAPAFIYSAAAQGADGAAGAFDIEVVQLGTVTPSRPARIGFNQET